VASDILAISDTTTYTLNGITMPPFIQFYHVEETDL